MRSSGSTPNPRREPPLARYVIVVGDDHPRACTGRRLLRQGLAVPAPTKGPGPPPIVLDPFAAEPLSSRDLPAAVRAGVAAVDCSWNRLSERGAFVRAGWTPANRSRRLPLLVATNPQHFGRIGELNTVEAIGAALYLLGRRAEGEVLLRGFAGGEAFFEVNRDRLERYARARSGEEVRALERALFGPGPAPATRKTPRTRAAHDAAGARRLRRRSAQREGSEKDRPSDARWTIRRERTDGTSARSGTNATMTPANRS